MITFEGEAIYELIPQRKPMMMVDAFYGATESEADTGFTIANDNIFCIDGFFVEPGLIEHIAQSASALTGYQALVANRPPPLCLIGEVKKCRIYFLPRAGDTLRTHIRILSEALDVSLFSAETIVDGETVVLCQMKIYNKSLSC